MTKRLFAMLLAAVMVLSMLPIGVWAEGTGSKTRAGHTHKVCNGSALCAGCAHTDVAYEAWESETTLPTSGNYYLTKDVTLSAQTRVSGTLNLCLNGHTVSIKGDVSTRHFWVLNGATLRLSNCSADDAVLTGGKNASIMCEYDKTVTIEVYNVVFRENAYTGTSGGGGAIMLQGKNSTLKLVGCKLLNNTAGGAGGAIRVHRAGCQVTLVGCEIKDNTAKTISAIRVDNTSTVTLIDTIVEGNKTTEVGDASKGAVYLYKSGANLVLEGKTQITGNADGADKVADLFLQKNENDGTMPLFSVSTKGLDKDARIGIVLGDSRLIAEGGLTASKALSGATAAATNFVAENENYKIKIENDTVVLVKDEGHIHKVCNGDTACADCAHTNVTYLPWGEGEGEATKLPTDAGNYYLTKDLTISEQMAVRADVNICLNGYSIAVKEGATNRHFGVYGAGNLTLSNCSGKESALTGGKDGSILSGSDSTGKIELYNVIFSGNSRTSSNGGAIVLQGKTKMTMVKCKLLDNAAKIGGAMYLNTTTTEPIMLCACEIKGNEATNRASAFEMNNGNAVLIDTVIEENVNTAKSGDNTYGAIYFPNSTGRTLTVAGATRITGNTDKDGKAVNVFFQNAAGKQAVVTVGEQGLSGDALIGVTLQAARLSAADGMTVTAKLNGANPVAYFASDNEAYMPILKDDTVVLGSVEANTHKHKICADSACADHADMIFQAWESDTSLPESGNYYLTKDVTITAQAAVRSDLNLCLNGHTVTVQDGATNRHFGVYGIGNLAVTNCDTTKEAVLTGGKDASILTGSDSTGKVELYNITVSGNSRTGSSGGAICLQGTTRLTMVNTKLLNNTAKNGGAIYSSSTNAASITMTGCEVKNNTATNIVSAIYLTKGVLTLNDTVIEGNKATKKAGNLSYGALFTPNNNYKIIVNGETRITGNTDKNDEAYNVVFQHTAGNQALITVGEQGLTGNALIGITMLGDRLSAGDGRTFTAKLNGADVASFFASDKTGYEIVVKDDALYLDDEAAHIHKLCNDSACTEHGDVKFKEWKKSNKLPTSGNYCLTADVTVGSNISVSGTLNLCLHGHSITMTKAERFFAINNGGVVSITDCTDNGKITGGHRHFGGGVATVNAGGTFNLFGGNLTGNSTYVKDGSKAMGGAVYLNPSSGTTPGGVFNMYGGKITDSSSDNEAGAVYGAAGSVINIYGGEISGNTSGGNGGAIYVTGATLNISGGKIADNTATKRSGAIYATGAAVNISGGEISGNTGSGSGGAISVAGMSVLNLTDGKITGNKGNSGGAIIVEGTGSKMVMQGGEISGNTGSTGGAVFVSTKTTFEMNGGVISGNTSSAAGGGITMLRSTVTLAGGEIKDNVAKGNGGGVQAEAGNLTISGTKITGNTAVNGGGVYIRGAKNGDDVYAASVTISGGEISGNTASGAGGGVTTQNADYDKLELTGDPVIKDNKAGDKISNLYLPANAVFTVGEMGERAKVGVSALSVYGAVSAKTDKDCTAAFTSDNSALAVVYKDSTVYLQPVDGHAHCLCNDKSTFCENHGTTVFAPWSDSKKLPSTAGNYYLTVDVKLSAVCSVSKDINICLNGHTITPTKNERTFALASGHTLSVTDCTDKGMITGGVRNFGGVINVNQGATFNLYGGNLTGNTNVKLTNENGKAGAIYLTKATDGQPGGVFNMYGGSVSKNIAFLGGAVFVCDGATMNLYGGTIAENQAYDRGGAIAAEGKATINILGGTITDNYAGKGAGVYVRNGAHIEMSGGLITKNKTGATTYEDKVISKGSGAAAISLTNQSTMTMTGGEISYNEGKGAGGAILVESKDTKLTMTGGKIHHNTTPSDGAGIYVSTNTIFEMSGGEITNNTAKKNGGGIYFLRSTGTITGGKISNNITTEGAGGGMAMARANVTLKGGSVSYNKTLKEKSAKGGGIMMNGATLNIYGGSIIGNSLGQKGTGGAAICTSTASETKNGVKTTFYSTINMYGGTIANHEGNYGGAMLLQSKTVMNMYGGTIRDNYAPKEGGAVCLYSQSQFHMSGGTMTGNKTDSRGGCVKFNAGTTGSFTGGTATGNYAGEYGGVFNAHGIDCKVVVKDVKMYGNECRNYGGAIAMTWNAVLDMDNCEFYENTAGEGGAMYLAHKTTCYLDDVKVYKNFSKDAGGAFYLDVGNNINFTNVKILDNEATKNGGAIYTRANVHLKDCLISGNVSGKDGGGIATSGAWTYGNDPANTNGYIGRGQGMIIENTVIDGNTCVGRGGGAFMAKKNWNTIIDSTFTNNVSGEMGSALFVGDDLKVVGMTVTGNTSKTDGYAVYFRENTYDGQSYIQAVHAMGGNVIVKDNQGGDIMLCDKIVISNTAEGYGKDTYFNVTLSDGVLTNRLVGEYNYEGGDQYYTVTYGSRSWTEPEVDSSRMTENEGETGSGDTWLYIGLGAFVAAIAAVVILLLAKKKKTGKPVEASQE